MISFFCPFCKHVAKATDELAGQLVACEQCKLEIRVPQPAAPPAEMQPARPSTISQPWWKRMFKRSPATRGVEQT